jgi:uncharacterized protein YecE (DUF72 family)
MIRVGIGGWTFAPWRGVFYPDDLVQARELQFASRQVTAIEINGTFYGLQKPASFRRWADETPDDFVFSLKAPRFATNRRILAEAAPSIERFLLSGPTELKQKLGPILWQFPPTKKFDPEDFAAFLALLPPAHDGVPLRHAVEVRHPSFLDAALLTLARRHRTAVVFPDAEKYPSIADVTASFTYLRLQRTAEDCPTGYPPAALKAWAQRAEVWAAGKRPDDLPSIEGGAPAAPTKSAMRKKSGAQQPAQEPPPRSGKPPAPSKSVRRGKHDVFVFMINGAKVRAPAAAMRLLKILAEAAPGD